MASYLQAAFNASAIALRDDCNAPNNDTLTTFPATQPHDLSSLLASLVPFATFARLPDWIKLAIIGSIIEACRRSVSWILAYITAGFTITARFEDDDTSYGEY
jgi:mitochondrial chaperone BCS1